MDKQNVIVLRKILYAVESGDQVYGRQDYSCFAGAGANCDNEIAITIGAGQWYADEAKELLYRIQRANPKLFKDIDNAGMESDLLMKNWDTYAVTAESAKGNVLWTSSAPTLERSVRMSTWKTRYEHTYQLSKKPTEPCRTPQ